MDNTVLALVVFIIGTAIGVGIGLGTGRLAKAAPENEDNDEFNKPKQWSGYYTRLELISRWQDCLARFQNKLQECKQIEDMAQLFAKEVKAEFDGLSIMLAIGPIRDIILLHTMIHKPQVIRLEQGSFFVHESHLQESSTMEDALTTELLRSSYDAMSEKQSSSHRWWTLRDVSQNLQANLFRIYHIKNTCLLVPMHYLGVMMGIIVVVGDDIGSNRDFLHDYGEHIAQAADIMTIWLRAMAPQIYANTAERPSPSIPFEALAAMKQLDNPISQIRSAPDGQAYMSELAKFSEKALQEKSEFTLLAIETCHTLQRATNASLVMFLKPEAKDSFSIEGILCGKLSWTPSQAFDADPIFEPFLQMHNKWPATFFFAAQKRRPLFAITREDVAKLVPYLSRLDITSLMMLPISIDGTCKGLLVAGTDGNNVFTSLDTATAMAITAISAMGLETIRSREINIKAKMAVTEACQYNTTIASQTLNVLTSIARMHAAFTKYQPQQILEIAEAIARQLHLPPDEIARIRIATLTCDIGKIAIPTSVLRKEKDLTPEELQMIAAHPQNSVNILKNFQPFSEVLPIVLHHHEQWDGSGYPSHLMGDEIPIGAQILAIAEAFIGYQGKQFQREEISQQDALTTIKAGSGTRFSLDMIQALTDALKEIKQSNRKTA
jgi:HD-GYP domain-containing protein (c-di-GMP phosphodiesterase class II)